MNPLLQGNGRTSMQGRDKCGRSDAMEVQQGAQDALDRHRVAVSKGGYDETNNG